MMKGATPTGSGSTPSASCVIVALPASATSYTSRGSTPPCSQTSCASPSSVSCARRCRRSSACRSSIVAEMREMTSAPNGCWRFSIDATATGVPVARSSSVATTVVVPRSKAMPWRRSVVSPGSTSISRSSTTTAVTCQSARAGVRPSGRSTRQLDPQLDVVERVEHAAQVGALVVQRRLLELQVALLDRRRRITWRPTPTVAAFGRVCSGGTCSARSLVACTRQASRHPSRSSSGENARRRAS